MEEQKSPNKKIIDSPSLSLPKGGGAIAGIGDTFQPNAFSGTGSYSVALPITPARGLEPILSLDYNSGAGNSPFGVGFSLSLPKISTRTEMGIPKYEGKDVFIMGSEELVPKQKKEYKDEEGWDVYEYLPRIEAAFSRIEQHIKEDKSQSYWKIITTKNETSFFGQSVKSRIYNPAKPIQIFEWLIDESFDAKGNRIIYTYKEEDKIGVPNKVWEQGRSFNNKYIQNIKYGNYLDSTDKEHFGFEVIFDYSEYDITKLYEGGKDPYKPVGTWKSRPDAFSSYTSGFEIRTCRLCHNILLFHHFENELGAACLVKSFGLNYKKSRKYGDTNLSTVSTLQSVILTGYKRQSRNANGLYEVQNMPAVTFGFSEFVPPTSPRFNELELNRGSIAGYLNFSGFQPIDLNSEGISGLLYHGNDSVFYCEPKGDGKYAAPNTLNGFPIDRNFTIEDLSLVDLESRGELELVVNNPNRAGFYQRMPDNSWGNFQTFQSYPTNFLNPKLEMVGLSNNGKTDLLMAQEDGLLVYPSIGKTGYSVAEKKIKPVDFPIIKRGYKKERVGFANLFGDGLSHRIKISNGNVECWPDLGYGRFGDKITLGNAPQFEEDFDISRLFLADIDGSGTTDIIYAYSNRVELYLNQCGNSFSNAITVYLPEQYNAIDQIGFSDILGNGTTCLVFTKMAEPPQHFYYDFVGETAINGVIQKSMKPYLLNEIDNNLGMVTQVEYCSSTKFYLEDKKAGNPWITKLPFPVQLVEKITVYDKITKSRYTQNFKYHEGFYDTIEKKFRGFGFVEAWDTENYETYLKNNETSSIKAKKIEKENYVPSVYTKVWHHTGAYFNNSKIATQFKEQYFQGDKKAYDFPDSVFENEIYQEDVETIRQAYAAMSGHKIRTEVYSDDREKHPKEFKNPYTVEESNLEVLLFQKREYQKYAVFMVNPQERISYHYERNPEDPRIQQKFSLTKDDFGNVLQSCTVFLPRRSGPEIDSIIYPEQQHLKGTVELIKFVHPLSEYIYCHVPCEEQVFELLGLDLKSKIYFDFNEIKTQVSAALKQVVPYKRKELISETLQAHQVSWNQTYFWNNRQSGRLLLQGISSRALPYNQEKAIFTKDFVSDVFDGRLTDETLQSKAGYFFHTDSGYWWNKGLVQNYFLPNQPSCFFMPSITENSFVHKSSFLFSKTTIRYDNYYLSPIEVAQYIDDNKNNIVKAEIDYITHQPKQIIDINNNITQALFDPLGQVIVTSMFGTENCSNIGGMTLYPIGEAQYNLPKDASFNDVINNPKKYLQGASSYFYYNLNAWSEKPQQPTCSVNLIRNNYGNSPYKDKTPYCRILISYTDGLGRELEKKLLTSPGIAFIRDSNGKLVLSEDQNPVQVVTESRWQVSGHTVYNNKGKPFEQYLPYFINTPEYEDQKDIPGPPPTVIHYDPLEREIRIDSPKGFFSKIEFTPWQEIYYDEDDTVLDSSYFQLNYPNKLNPGQLHAIDKALKFYNTPNTKVIDNIGNIFLEIQNNLGNVSKNAFDKIVKGTSLTSEEIWNELQAKEYLKEEDKEVTNTKRIKLEKFYWLTQKFQPYVKGFELKLDKKFDSLVVKITNLLKQNDLTSYFCTDISGRKTESIDPRLYYSKIKETKAINYYNFQYKYAMGEESPILVNSIDAGTEKHLNNIYGEQLWSWSPRNYCQLISYDRLQRKTELLVKKITAPGPVTYYGDFSLVEAFTYGKPDPDDQAKNLNGQLIRIKDLSGIILNSQYSMLGEVLETSRQMIKGYKTAVNWKNIVLPENEIYTTRYSYNAVKQLIRETTPDDSVTTNTYNQAGQLNTVIVQFPDKSTQQIVGQIEYDAKGQRTSIKYGNKVNTKYTYEETTLRLIAIKSTRPVAGRENPEIQNNEYYYDPVGNITRNIDNTINIVFNKNQKVEPVSNYTYDAIYRLIKADGRQHQGITVNTYKNNAADGSFKQCIYGPPPSINDANKLENYSERYTYDDSGNLLKKQHTAVSAPWARKIPVEDNSNRMLNIEYDASGNMNQLYINSNVNFTFNCCENLVKAGIIERPIELDDTDYFLYDSQELRTRKVCERMAHGGDATQIEDKIYLGNFEILRNYAGSTEQPAGLKFEKQTLRVMDDKDCVAIIYYITVDKQNPEKEETRQCLFQMDNNLGSVILELDKNAKLITYEEYFPYGGTAIITGISQAEVNLKVYRYSGKERDDSTGLYYYGARYYASWLGRWLKPDPAGTVDGMNLYAFVGGNPISKIDIDGLMMAPNSGRKKRKSGSDSVIGVQNMQGLGAGAQKRRRAKNSAAQVDVFVATEVNDNLDIDELGRPLDQYVHVSSLGRRFQSSMLYLAPPGSEIRDDLVPPADILAQFIAPANPFGLDMSPLVSTISGIHGYHSRSTSRRLPVEVFTGPDDINLFFIHSRSNRNVRARAALVAQAFALLDRNPGEPMLLAGDFNQDPADVQAMINLLPWPRNAQLRVYIPSGTTHVTRSSGEERTIDYVISNIAEGDIFVSATAPSRRTGNPDHALLKIRISEDPLIM